MVCKLLPFDNLSECFRSSSYFVYHNVGLSCESNQRKYHMSFVCVSVCAYVRASERTNERARKQFTEYNFHKQIVDAQTNKFQSIFMDMIIKVVLPVYIPRFSILIALQKGLFTYAADDIPFRYIKLRLPAIESQQNKHPPHKTHGK